MKVKSGIEFFSQQYSDAMMINKVHIDLTQNDIANILKASEIIKENKFIDSVRVSVQGTVDFFNEENENINNDWRCDVVQFIVHHNMFFLYAQNKWHSGDQIETRGFQLNPLKKKLVK